MGGGHAAMIFFADMNEGLVIKCQLVRECEQFLKSMGVSRRGLDMTESLISASRSLAL